MPSVHETVGTRTDRCSVERIGCEIRARCQDVCRQDRVTGTDLRKKRRLSMLQVKAHGEWIGCIDTRDVRVEIAIGNVVFRILNQSDRERYILRCEVHAIVPFYPVAKMEGDGGACCRDATVGLARNLRRKDRMRQKRAVKVDQRFEHQAANEFLLSVRRQFWIERVRVGDDVEVERRR